MNRFLFFIVFPFVTSLTALAADMKIAVGMSEAEVRATLTKSGMPFGEEYALQMIPPEGFGFVFGTLDDHSLVVVYKTDTKKVSELRVYLPAPVMRTRADGVILKPIAIEFSDSTYSLVFKKEANQALVPTVMSVTPAADAPVAPATTAAHL